MHILIHYIYIYINYHHGSTYWLSTRSTHAYITDVAQIFTRPTADRKHVQNKGPVTMRGGRDALTIDPPPPPLLPTSPPPPPEYVYILLNAKKGMKFLLHNIQTLRLLYYIDRTFFEKNVHKKNYFRYFIIAYLYFYCIIILYVNKIQIDIV